ncbi:hypothetical protein ACK3BE_32575 (plasmid) [Pseudomonas mandelii]|uniref:hypothetical protein n=1 Tax=Pseudomonas mandelii TaxID=75612 RepID=UPI00398C8F67
MKLNSVIFRYGLIIQVLVLAAFIFVKTPIMSCPDKNNISSTSNSESYNSEARPLKTTPDDKSDEKYKWVSLIPLNLRRLETALDNTDIQYENFMVDWLQYLLVAGGFMVMSGLIMMVFRRKKSVYKKQFHLCSLMPELIPLTYQSCNHCSIIVKHKNNKEPLSSSAMIWVIEITVSSALDRKKTAAAIKGMSLPAIRLENNFIIIGPYKSKSEASEIVRKLRDAHNVRGWLTPGN